MPNIVLQVKTDLKTTLHEINAASLSPEIETLLEGQILDLINPEHKIRHLISKYCIGPIKFILHLIYFVYLF